MKTKKSIKRVTSTELVPLGEVSVDQALPVKEVEQIDPFLLIHHAKVQVPAGTNQSKIGVGPHPHRGFSPVTFVYKGSVLHHDSEGNRAEVTDGGIQWMHSGKGIVHSERPGKEFAERGGEQEIIQFWINSPAKNKMDEPTYVPLDESETPELEREKVKIGVVAGKYENFVGSVPTFSPQTILKISADEGADFSLSIPQTFNCLLYLLDGRFVVNGEQAKGKKMVWFNNDGTEINIQAKGETRAILLSGEPIGEPVSAYGPFVMNTNNEILDAIRDSQEGKMGTLIEKF